MIVVICASCRSLVRMVPDDNNWYAQFIKPQCDFQQSEHIVATRVITLMNTAMSFKAVNLLTDSECEQQIMTVCYHAQACYDVLQMAR